MNALELTARQKEIGSTAGFGSQDVLIESHTDYAARLARDFLANHFPDASAYDLDMLLNPPQRYRSTWLVPDLGTWNRVVP